LRAVAQSPLEKAAAALTARQQELLDYLRSYQRSEGVMPSTRDIQRHFGFSSQTAAMSHLRALEKKGVIQRHAHKARAVVFPADLDRAEIIDIPVFGQIPAGMAGGHGASTPRNASPWM
jgi:repressor LexA